jgi:phthalate 4,5-cis-dihydrodiol dehydrogenase
VVGPFCISASLPATAQFILSDSGGAGVVSKDALRILYGDSGMAGTKKRPITAAVLGLGRSGWNIHIRGIRDRKDYKVLDVADPIKERRQQAEEELGCASHATVKELLRKTKAELVIVATQSVDHCPHTLAALKAGKHVAVEKPMAMTHAQAKRMVATAKKCKKKLLVHQNHRFAPHTQLFKHITSGKTEIGKVFNIVYQSYGFARRNDWQCLKKYGGGLLNNKLTHIMDAILYMVGSEVSDVMCDMRHTTDSGDCEDHVTMIMKTRKGVTINILDSSSCNADAPNFLFMGEYGTVTGTRSGGEMRYFDPKKHKKLRVVDARAAGERKYGNAEQLKWKTKELTTKSFNIGNFYDNVWSVLRERGKMVVTPASVVEMTRVIELCRKQNPEFIL